MALSSNKRKLLKEIFKSYESVEPRPIEWYGERFDKLIDLSEKQLELLCEIRKSKNENRVKT